MTNDVPDEKTLHSPAGSVTAVASVFPAVKVCKLAPLAKTPQLVCASVVVGAIVVVRTEVLTTADVLVFVTRCPAEVLVIVRVEREVIVVVYVLTVLLWGGIVEVDPVPVVTLATVTLTFGT
jgi:hypothetical protein